MKTFWIFIRPTLVKIFLFLVFYFLVYGLGEYCEDVRNYLAVECPSPAYSYFSAMGYQAYIVYYLVACLIAFFFRGLTSMQD